MKINKDSWHYKVWRKSFQYKSNIPEETDLCRYCHKVFWALVGYAALVSLLCVSVGGLAAVVFYVYGYKGLWLHTLPTVLGTLAVATVILAIVFYNRWLNRGRSYSEPKTLVGQYARATKQRVCPLVEFED